MDYPLSYALHFQSIPATQLPVLSFKRLLSINLIRKEPGDKFSGGVHFNRGRICGCSECHGTCSPPIVELIRSEVRWRRCFAVKDVVVIIDVRKV